MQIGNFVTPREGFDNPQEGRIYARGGQSPTMRAGGGGVYWIMDNDLTKDNMAKIYKVIAIDFIKHDQSEGSGGTGYSQWDVVKVSLNDGKEVFCNISNYYNDINASREDLFYALPPMENPVEAYEMLSAALPWIKDAPIDALEEKYLQPKKTKVYRIRKLTPRECGRLMGCSDRDIDKIQRYPFVPNKKGNWELPQGMTDADAKKLKISESQQYKMFGNSIVVQVLEGIFTQMFRVDSDCLF